MSPCHPGFWASGKEILFEEEKKLSPLTWKSAQIGKKRFHFFGRKWRVKDWMHRCRIKTYEMHLPPHPLPHFQNPKYKHCTQLDSCTNVLISGWQGEVWHFNMTYDGTGSVEGSTGWYLVVLGQYGVELVDTWWCWVSRRRYWLVLGGTGSVWDGTGLLVLGGTGSV